MTHSFQPWTDPRGLAAAKSAMTTGDYTVKRHGPDIWDMVCYLGCTGEGFRPREIATRYAREQHLAPKTAKQYVNAFIAYCLAAPDEFSGPASRLVRVRRGFYRLEDNPER